MDESPYRWLHQLGSGSSGIVWAAEREGEEIAVKVLRIRPGSPHAEAIRRELTLGPLLAGHPGIVSVRRVESFGQALCLEMALVKGPSLAQVLDQRTSAGLPGLPATVVAQWGIEILETLDWASHRVAPGNPRSFVHRDIKPANLLLDPTGRIRITDFGIARAGAALGFQTTQSGVLKGSPRFMAPEILQDRRVDARADQFSVAVVLYELLGGEPLYVGRTLDEVLALAMVADVRSALATLDAPRGLVAALRRMLGRSPEDRYATARQAAQALDAVELTGPTLAETLPALMSARDRVMVDERPPGSSTMPLFEEADDIATTVEDDEVVVHLPRDLRSPAPAPVGSDTDEITRPVPGQRNPPVSDMEDEPATVVSVEPLPLPREEEDEEPETTDLGGFLDPWPGVDAEPPDDETTEKPTVVVAEPGEHTVGAHLEPEPPEDPEPTVGSFLQPAVVRGEDDPLEHTVGTWLEPVGVDPPPASAPDPHDASTVESRKPAPDAFADEEETRVEPRLAYSEVLPPSMELSTGSEGRPRRRLLLALGVGGMVLGAALFVALVAALVAAAMLVLLT